MKTYLMTMPLFVAALGISSGLAARTESELYLAFASTQDGVYQSRTAGELAEKLAILDQADLAVKVRVAYDCLNVLVQDTSTLDARIGELSTLPRDTPLTSLKERAAMTLEWMLGIREPLDLGSLSAISAACGMYRARLEEMKRLGVEAQVAGKTEDEVLGELRSRDKIMHNTIEQWEMERLATSTNAAIRKAVLALPNINSPHIITMLRNDEDPEIRIIASEMAMCAWTLIGETPPRLIKEMQQKYFSTNELFIAGSSEAMNGGVKKSCSGIERSELSVSAFNSHFESVQTTPTNVILKFMSYGENWACVVPGAEPRVVQLGETLNLSVNEEVLLKQVRCTLSLKGFSTEKESGFDVVCIEDNRAWGHSLKRSEMHWVLHGSEAGTAIAECPTGADAKVNAPEPKKEVSTAEDR